MTFPAVGSGLVEKDSRIKKMIYICAAVLLVGAAIAFLRQTSQKKEELNRVQRPLPPSVKNTSSSSPDRSSRLIDWICDQALAQTSIQMKNDPLALTRIEEASVKCLQALQTSESTEIDLPFISADASGPKHFRATVTRKMAQDIGAL